MKIVLADMTDFKFQDKFEALRIKVERHLSKHETTSTNAKWLKWFFDFSRTAILVYIAIKGLF